MNTYHNSKWIIGECSTACVVFLFLFFGYAPTAAAKASPPIITMAKCATGRACTFPVPAKITVCNHALLAAGAAAHRPLWHHHAGPVPCCRVFPCGLAVALQVWSKRLRCNAKSPFTHTDAIYTGMDEWTQAAATCLQWSGQWWHAAVAL